MIINKNNEDRRVMFEEENYLHYSDLSKKSASKMAGWVIKFSGGKVKNERQVNFVLVTIIIISVTISLFLILDTGGSIPSQKDIQILPAEY